MVQSLIFHFFHSDFWPINQLHHKQGLDLSSNIKKTAGGAREAQDATVQDSTQNIRLGSNMNEYGAQLIK